MELSVDRINSLAKKIEQLKAENERLTKLLENAYKREEDVRGQLGEAECMLNRYDRKLQEIKEIVEKDFNHTCWEDYAEQLKQILQKISDCEVEE